MEFILGWFVYIIQAKNGHLYTGISTDFERRLKQHRGEISGGAKFFRGNPPKKILYLEEVRDRSTASKREAEIKKLTRKEKLELISPAHQKRIPSAR